MAASTKTTLKIVNPANGDIVTELETDNSLSIIEKFNRAMASQLEWVQSPLLERESIVKNFEYKLLLQKNILSENLALESGKLIRDCEAEIELAIESSQFFRNHYKKVLNPQKEIRRKNIQERLDFAPLGVIAHISSSDLPFLTAISVIIPALLTGNTVLYKPGEFASLSGLAIVELLYESGLPDDILIPVIGNSFAGQELLKWPVQGVFFFGTNETGKQINDICSRRLTHLQMELGSSNAVYVCNDADLDKAARDIVKAAFYHSGQSRINPKRIFVDESCYDDFHQNITELTRSYSIGDPLEPATNMGPVIRELQFDQLIADASAKGAQCTQTHQNLPEKGHYVSPVIIKDANEDMEILNREVIGPMLILRSVQNDIEAVHYINDSDHGLYVSVYTKNQDRADRVLENAQAGILGLNCCAKISPYLPRNGRKESGLGTTMGIAGIRNFVKPRSWFIAED